MIATDGTSGSAEPPQDTRTSTDRGHYLRSPPLSPANGNRFIVEPQVLNAAFEQLDYGERRPFGPSLPHSAGGLPPPPRPNSRRPPPSNLPSPADSLEIGIPSLPNSPTSSPFSNGPGTPGGNWDLSPKPTPRLSNFLRGDTMMFGVSRGSMAIAEQGNEYDDPREDDESQTASLRKWSSRSTGDPISPLDSGPSSPEFSASSIDGPRPPRHNRYFSGLQKITRLAKPKASLNALSDSGGRGGRRLSDAEVDPRRNSQEKGSSSDLSVSGRIRGMLDKGAKGASGELIKQPASVPSSPVAPSGVKNANTQEEVRMGEGEGRLRRPSAGGSTFQSARAGVGQTGLGGANARAGRGDSPLNLQPPPRAWVSHARQASDMSTTSSLASLGPSLFPASASDSSHDPPSSHTDARISISSTIYPSSSNNHSFDIARYPLPGRSPMHSPDRESFIDLASPTFSPLNANFKNFSIPEPSQSSRAEQPIPYDSSNDFSHGESPARSTKPHLPRLLPTGADKPPIPTTPKPDFSRLSRSGQSASGKASKTSPKHGSPMSTFASDLDRSLTGLTTTNALSARERAQRVRTTHKLTQLFGQTPGVSPISPQNDAHLPNGCLPIPGNLALNLNAKRKHSHQHHRPAVSMSEDVVTPVFEADGMAWPPPDSTHYLPVAARRHSAPLSPDEFAFMAGPGGRRSNESGASRAYSAGSAGGRDDSSVIEIGTAEGDTASVAGSGRWTSGREGPGSPLSFMDLSDEEGGEGDGLSEILAETPRGPRTRLGGQRLSPAELSDSLSLSAEELAEDERRRKREKLAKLHRFLGSRVPPHLVLGTLDEGTPLPPLAAPSPSTPLVDDDAAERRLKMRRRRSSSAAEFSKKWSDDIDRLKEELNEREKAINVRRAVKMEKMFGVAPPQTLYHTRAPTSSSNSLTASTSSKAPPSPRAAAPRSPSAPAFRITPSDSGLAYKSKSKKKGARPGTSDSSEPLIRDDSNDFGLLDAKRSSVYMHYRHSLNSLNDIIDRDDRESLAELHDYLTGPSAPLADDLVVVTPTSKAERRRSLPSRTSIASFTSEISLIVAPTPTEPSFQQRRRRAAKLTHFFGVDYRELMSEILESIEKGLEEERGRGTLRPDEVRDLQKTLVSLKTKRNSLRQAQAAE